MTRQRTAYVLALRVNGLNWLIDLIRKTLIRFMTSERSYSNANVIRLQLNQVLKVHSRCSIFGS
ncbi:hypothetical protein Pan54_21150 [Rubinisphaera italica]|uniref:Transposase DDE domain-containing protein n=1 Tax=Rubinisphaera italica TaxID=2527969 RepID=A0A5C5XFE8_9PLAN|nr:hypothetical protein Pan54_21150 [Rubinisphaera italica]